MKATKLHILKIDLSKLSKYELIDLSCKFMEAVSTSKLYTELTEELISAQKQINTFSELINK